MLLAVDAVDVGVEITVIFTNCCDLQLKLSDGIIIPCDIQRRDVPYFKITPNNQSLLLPLLHYCCCCVGDAAIEKWLCSYAAAIDEFVWEALKVKLYFLFQAGLTVCWVKLVSWRSVCGRVEK